MRARLATGSRARGGAAGLALALGAVGMGRISGGGNDIAELPV